VILKRPWDTVSGSTLSARATARLIAVCAVLVGLFFMHGLPAQHCSGGVGGSAPMMTHSPTVAIAADDPGKAAGGMTASASRSLAESAAGAVCVSTPPPPGWAGLLALLLAIGAVGLAGVLRSAQPATQPRNLRLRAPPLAGAALLMNLCVFRT
jgi:hypothetical protein